MNSGGRGGDAGDEQGEHLVSHSRAQDADSTTDAGQACAVPTAPVKRGRICTSVKC
jgi:hypothetical protein